MSLRSGLLISSKGGQSSRIVRVASSVLCPHSRQIAGSALPKCRPSIQPTDTDRYRLLRSASKASSTRRTFTSAPPSSETSSSTSLTEDEYNEIADRDMDILHESVEILCEEYGPSEWEVEYSSGVMTIRLPPHGTYVINKQPPNQQIWISSPISGPSRFGWDPNEEAWTHHRKPDVRLGKLLEEEIRELAGRSQVEADAWEGTGLK